MTTASRHPTRAFALLAPPLVGIAVVLSVVAWGVLPRIASGSSAPAALPEGDALVAPAATTADTAVPPAAEPRRLIAPARGVVGSLRIGMTLAQAERALGEDLVPVSRSTARTARFEYVAPGKGVVVKGIRSRITTITVTNAGTAAMAWRTGVNLGIGSRTVLVTRTYPGAQPICGEEHWTRAGRFTVRFGGRARVTSVTVTNDPPPLFVPCT